MRVLNICFCGEISKIIPGLSRKSPYQEILSISASPEASTTNQTEVFFLPTTSQTQPGSVASGQTPIVISANVDSVTSSTLSEQTDDFDDDDFCMINDTGWGKAVRSHLL